MLRYLLLHFFESFSSFCRRDTGFGIYAKFLEILGPEFRISWGAHESVSFEAARLDKSFFIPSTDYLQEVLQHPAVCEYVRRKRFRTNLYRVTGIRIASLGSRGTIQQSRDREQRVDLSAEYSGSWRGTDRCWGEAGAYKLDSDNHCIRGFVQFCVCLPNA